LGFGVGVWVFGFGVLGLGPNPPTPNPQSPIPNPHELIKREKFIFKLNNFKIILFIYFLENIVLYQACSFY